MNTGQNDYYSGAVNFLKKLPRQGTGPGSQLYAVKCFEVVLQKDILERGSSAESQKLSKEVANKVRNIILGSILSFIAVTTLIAMSSGSVSFGLFLLPFALPLLCFVAVVFALKHLPQSARITPLADYFSRLSKELAAENRVSDVRVSYEEAKKYLADSYELMFFNQAPLQAPVMSSNAVVKSEPVDNVWAPPASSDALFTPSGSVVPEVSDSGSVYSPSSESSVFGDSGSGGFLSGLFKSKESKQPESRKKNKSVF